MNSRGKSVVGRREMNRSGSPSSIRATFSREGLPNQLRSFLRMVVVMLVMRRSPSVSFRKSKKKMSPLMLCSRKNSRRVFLHSLNEVSSTSMNATAERILSSGTNPVGSVEAFFFRLWRLSISFTGSSIVYFVLAAISSRISCLASRQRGMSILVPMTSTTFAAMMEPTSPQTRRGIPREWAYRKPAA